MNFLNERQKNKLQNRRINKTVKRLNKKGISVLSDVEAIKETNQTNFEFLKSKMKVETAVHIYNDFAVKDFVASL